MAWIKFVIFIAVLLSGTQPCFAQDKGGKSGGAPEGKDSIDIGIFGGSLLPSRMGLREIVPGWGLRASRPTEKGIFEFAGFFGRGNGIIYNSLTTDFRMDIAMDIVAAHFLLGFHGDQYDSTSPVPASSKFSGGWHYGGGFSQYLGASMFLRFDFRHRFSPGQILEVTLGITYRLPSGGNSP